MTLTAPLEPFGSATERQLLVVNCQLRAASQAIVQPVTGGIDFSASIAQRLLAKVLLGTLQQAIIQSQHLSDFLLQIARRLPFEITKVDARRFSE